MSLVQMSIEFRSRLSSNNNNNRSDEEEEGLPDRIQISAKLIFTTWFLLFAVSPDSGSISCILMMCCWTAEEEEEGRDVQCIDRVIDWVALGNGIYIISERGRFKMWWSFRLVRDWNSDNGQPIYYFIPHFIISSI